MNKPTEVLTLQSNRYVITIKENDVSYKVFQVSFSNDGSLFVHFPYFKDSNGLASQVTLSPGLKYPASGISLTDSGKVTSHRIKFSHHPDGKTHFSQTGKIFTRVKKQSIPLRDINGHIFTVMLQGLEDFKVANGDKDGHKWTSERSVVEFNVDGLEYKAFKFVALWKSFEKLASEMSVVGHATKAGPKIIRRAGDDPSVGFLLSPVHHNPMKDYVLVLAIEGVPLVDVDDKPTILFIGGFDSVDVVNDLAKQTSMLTLMYPTKNTDELINEIGSIDFVSTK